mmetsp:Transcript_10496/g.11311  ORF Transcript_10496/g.11311 Transcript_10496/m.11311 type:complete len:474 (+) Transcript_10496:22-1443(+)
MRQTDHRRWSYRLYLIICLIVQLHHVVNVFGQAGSTDSCESLYKETRDVWLFGEVPDGTPFAAQLHAIHSYAPVTFVFQTALVVGVLSVQEPVKENEAVIDWRGTSAPFSSFFDLNHYAWYWSQHGLKIVSEKFYHNCFVFNPMAPTKRFLHDRSNISRIPEFYPYAKDDFRNLFYYANTTKEETFQFPFPSHRQVRIQSRFGWVGFYSFWNDMPMLQYVLASLKPAVPIEKFAKALLSLIPAEFVAIHLRVDDDAFSQIEGVNSHIESETRAIKKIVQYIKQSPCLAQYFQQKTNGGNAMELPELVDFGEVGAGSGVGELPALYLSTNNKPQTRNEKRRTRRLIEELVNSGFINIYTRKLLYDKYARKKNTSASGGDVNADGLEISAEEVNPIAGSPITDLSIMRMLNPEQLAFADIIVSRSCKCFVPSYIPSLASYLIKRYMKFDQNIFEKYDDITAETYGNHYFYREWGF